MKLKTFIIMGLTSLFARNCCAQPPRPFGKRTIILDGFGFSTLITDIFPNRLTSARAATVDINYVYRFNHTLKKLTSYGNKI
jgi:hypothetical protein